MTPARQRQPFIAVGHVTLDHVGERRVLAAFEEAARASPGTPPGAARTIPPNSGVAPATPDSSERHQRRPATHPARLELPRKLLGGSAWYAASAWRALGERVRLITAAGPELPPLPAWRGLDVHLRRAPRTTEFSNHHLGGGRRRLVLHAQASPVPPLDSGPPCEVLFLAPVLGEVPFEPWRRGAEARLLAVGLQGWLKRADPTTGEVHARPDQVDPALFEGADVACLSEEDLAGDDRWLARLTEVVPVVALTLAERGCDLIRAGRSTRIPAVRAADEVDPTGAGDIFAAGLVRALARGATPVEAATLGAALGAMTVEHLGPPPPAAIRSIAG